MSEFIIENGVLKGYWGVDEVITVPEEVTSIGQNAFWNNPILKSISLPEGITAIGEGAFRNCTGLESINLPSGVVAIGEKAFCDCSKLKKLTIPDSVKEIGLFAFSGCYGDGIHASEAVMRLVKNSCFSIYEWAGKRLLMKYGGLGGIVETPSEVQTINFGAFQGCKNVVKVILPDTVTNIGAQAFSSCSDLEEISLPATINRLEQNTFYDCQSLKAIVLPDSLKVIDEGVFYGCKSMKKIQLPKGLVSIGAYAFKDCAELVEMNIPDGLTEIRSDVFHGCKSMKKIQLPKGLVSIGAYAFMDCAELVEMNIPDGLTEIVSGAFKNCGKLKCLVSEKRCVSKDKLSTEIARATIETTDRGLAYLILYQRSPLWKNWRQTQEFKDPEKLLEIMLEILQKEVSFDVKTGDAVAEFIQRFLKQLKSETIAGVFTLFEGRKNKTIDALKKYPDVQAYISGNAEEERESVRLAKEILMQIGSVRDAESAVRNRIHYKNEDALCSREELIAVLSVYAREWDRCSEDVTPELNTVRMLTDGTKVKVDPNADAIAEALDKKELSEWLDPLVRGLKYRSYILAWARFADEDRVSQMTGDFKKLKRGKAKERYFAENLEQALLISETRAAMQFYDEIDQLDRYAAVRGLSAMEMRDTRMMPNLGFDQDGMKRYDIGGNVVEVSIDSSLKLHLFNVDKAKELKSFPKKSDNPAKAEQCAKDYMAFKKEVDALIKLRTEQLLKMHISGETVENSLWRKVYLTHPVIRHLAELIIWTDEEKRLFSVTDGRIVDSHCAHYDPKGRIHVAHVLEMNQAEIDAWRSFMISDGRKQLFEQIWEPIIGWDPETVVNRYDGAVISSSERNSVRVRLGKRGIKAYAKEMDKEFNARNWEYNFSNEGTMIYGKSMQLDYTVDEVTKDITFRKIKKLHASPGNREMNAILFELDRAIVRCSVTKDDSERLTESVLDSFTAAQISELLDLAAEKTAVKCSAILLDYKNSHYKAYGDMSGFVLEW